VGGNGRKNGGKKRGKNYQGLAKRARGSVADDVHKRVGVSRLGHQEDNYDHDSDGTIGMPEANVVDSIF
jgi:hypothetical protein